MHPSPQATPGHAQSELFPQAWLASEPLRTLIHTAPMGIALLSAVRSESGQIINFRYQLANPMQRALTDHPEKDLLTLPLTSLSPDVRRAGVLNRLIKVVNTGRPGQFVEEYRLDGSIGRYDQVYVKCDDGVLMLVQDVTYNPMSTGERNQQTAFLEAIQLGASIATVRSRLVALISGQTLIGWAFGVFR